MTTNKDLRRRETDKFGEWVQQAALDDANARVSILTEANASNLRVMAVLSDSLKDANKRIAELESENSKMHRELIDSIAKSGSDKIKITNLAYALQLISEWSAPMVNDSGVKRSYSYMYGSNGERDYFRNIADETLRTWPAAAKEGE